MRIGQYVGCSCWQTMCLECRSAAELEPCSRIIFSAVIAPSRRSPHRVVAMSCCRSLCGFSPKLSSQISSKLNEVQSIFPHSTFIVVLTPEGELLASSQVEYQRADELLAPIASLKKTAVQFGAALSQMECPVIHVRGNNHMFSCYDVDKNVSNDTTQPSASDRRRCMSQSSYSA
jgi:hypothetical protein